MLTVQKVRHLRLLSLYHRGEIQAAPHPQDPDREGEVECILGKEIASDMMEVEDISLNKTGPPARH